jgi:hypothetical protein
MHIIYTTTNELSGSDISSMTSNLTSSSISETVLICRVSQVTIRGGSLSKGGLIEQTSTPIWTGKTDAGALLKQLRSAYPGESFALVTMNSE